MYKLRNIKPKKSSEWHARMHPYFTKQPANVIAEYIKAFSKEGDTVLDPFSGTGTTGIASLELKRKVRLFDLSPFSCFISKETVRTDFDLNKFKAEHSKIVQEIEGFEETIWELSDGELEKYKILDWYPKKVKMPKNADFDFVHNLFDKKQLIVFARLLAMINQIEDEKVKQQMRLVFSNTLGKCNLTYMPSEKDGKQVGGGGSSIFGKYRYWKPKESRVLRVSNNFDNRCKYLITGKTIAMQKIGDFFDEESYQIYNTSATNICEKIEENSIDYIYTDPPYGAHIAYLDLATMWNAWLGFDVSDDTKNEEIIEGGDLKHSRDHYLDLMFEVAKQCHRVLKKGKKLSLVFQHKDTNLWFRILDCFRDAGFETEDMFHQTTATTSMHKKKNPLNVFGDQIIVNFIKPEVQKQANIQTRQDGEIVDLILKKARKVIVDNIEASAEEIQSAVLDELYLHNKVNTKAIQKIDFLGILNENFAVNKYDKYTLKPTERRNILLAEKSDINERILYVIYSLFRENDKATIDEIIANVNMYAKNGHEIAKQSVMNILSDIADVVEGKYYILRKNWYKEPTFKKAIDRDLLSEGTLSEHDNTIYKLAMLGQKFGYRVYVGQTEQRKSEVLRNISNFDVLPQGHVLNKFDKGKIEQIDCLWLDKDDDIVYAFEVETSTTVKSGLERFLSLLKANYTQCLTSGAMVVIIPDDASRINVLKRELQDGTFAGAPFYMNKKTKFCFLDSIREDVANIEVFAKEFKEI